MDIINKLHSAFREAEHFEFGDDFVRFYDRETEKRWEVSIREFKPKAKAKSETITAAELKKLK